MFILFLWCLELCLVLIMLRRLSDRFVCWQRALSLRWVLGLKFKLGKTLMESKIFKEWGELIPQKEGRNLAAGMEVSLIHLYSIGTDEGNTWLLGERRGWWEGVDTT